MRGAFIGFARCTHTWTRPAYRPRQRTALTPHAQPLHINYFDSIVLLFRKNGHGVRSGKARQIIRVINRVSIERRDEKTGRIRYPVFYRGRFDILCVYVRFIFGVVISVFSLSGVFVLRMIMDVIEFCKWVEADRNRVEQNIDLGGNMKFNYYMQFILKFAGKGIFNIFSLQCRYKGLIYI